MLTSYALTVITELVPQHTIPYHDKYVTGLTSACLCITWYLFHEHLGWIWILQNFLGVSVCILFLSSVHLPNLQTATMLLGIVIKVSY